MKITEKPLTLACRTALVSLAGITSMALLRFNSSCTAGLAGGGNRHLNLSQGESARNPHCGDRFEWRLDGRAREQ